MALDLARGQFSKGTWSALPPVRRRDSRSRSRRRRRSRGEQSRDAPSSSGGASIGATLLAYNRVQRQEEQRPQGGAPASSAGSVGVDRYGTREDWGQEHLGKGPPVEDESARTDPRGPGGKGPSVVDLDAWASDVSEDRTRTGGEAGEHVPQSCHGFADKGTCRFGQGCKFLHGDAPGEAERARAARDHHERRMHKHVDLHHVGSTLLYKDKDSGEWKLLLCVTTMDDGTERLGWIKQQKRRGDGEEEDALAERCRALTMLTDSMTDPVGTQVTQDAVHLGVVKEDYSFRRDYGHGTANVHTYALGPEASGVHGEALVGSLKQGIRLEDLVWYCRDGQRGPRAMEMCDMLAKAGWPVNVHRQG